MLQRAQSDGEFHLAVDRCRRVALLLALGLAGCDAAIGGGPSTAAPVLQVLLVAGDSVQRAMVEWRFPADSDVGFNIRPVDSALVQLSLVLPGSASVPFAAQREQPGGGFFGRYEAPARVAYGAIYQLEGTIVGHVVSATTTVPDSLSIVEPAQDTIRIAAGSCFGLCSLPYHWVADGADEYQYIQTKAGSIFWSGSTPDTSGVISISQRRAGADTAMLVVFALETHAAAFLVPETPKSSVTGVFGFFGAASRGQRVLLWQ